MYNSDRAKDRKREVEDITTRGGWLLKDNIKKKKNTFGLIYIPQITKHIFHIFFFFSCVRTKQNKKTNSYSCKMEKGAYVNDGRQLKIEMIIIKLNECW